MTTNHDVEESWIAAITHGRYLVRRGDAGEGAPLLIGFHGYGENAERHLEKLRRIEGADAWLLCAVSALHPFYNTRTGEVIDCWMTSRGREQAIIDNVSYVSRVIADVRRRYRPSSLLVFAGFSQGVALAYRAAAASGGRCHGLIALAGDVPPDVATGVATGDGLPRGGLPRGGLPRGGLPRVLVGRGTTDPLYTAEKMHADLRVLETLGIEVETCVFEGGHDWTPEIYTRAGEFLRRLATPRSGN